MKSDWLGRQEGRNFFWIAPTQGDQVRKILIQIYEYLTANEREWTRIWYMWLWKMSFWLNDFDSAHPLFSLSLKIRVHSRLEHPSFPLWPSVKFFGFNIFEQKLTKGFNWRDHRAYYWPTSTSSKLKKLILRNVKESQIRKRPTEPLYSRIA
jgi:hypothetical protein